MSDFSAWDIQDSLDVFGLGFSATVQRFVVYVYCLFGLQPSKTVFSFPFYVYEDGKFS